MEIIKSWIWVLVLICKKIFSTFYSPKEKESLAKIPFYSQQDTEAKDKETDWLWQTNGCGMACLKMILKFKTNQDYSIS